MKKNFKLAGAVLMASTVLVFSSCNKDKNVYADDLSVTMDENPSSGEVVGTVVATTEKSYITYTLASQSPAGALIIDPVSGELTVDDASLFNFEINPIITATVEADNGKNADVSAVTITLTDVSEIPAAVGEFRDGGVVFWVNPLDIHQGLVCSVSDLASSSANWGCFDIINPTAISGANGTAVGTGAQNTIDIEAGCTTVGTAADICANSSLNGYTDWFLPSKDEMTAIYNNKTMVNATSTANGGTTIDESVLYWSSTQSSADKAFDFYFFNGVSEATLKLNVFSVRAVRSF
ncbi:MAG: hypothetical protein ACJA1C_001106 [Crocinitomicaceae bacterium]|jgi:hypothetical protein